MLSTRTLKRSRHTVKMISFLNVCVAMSALPGVPIHENRSRVNIWPIATVIMLMKINVVKDVSILNDMCKYFLNNIIPNGQQNASHDIGEQHCSLSKQLQRPTLQNSRGGKILVGRKRVGYGTVNIWPSVTPPSGCREEIRSMIEKLVIII